MKTTALIPWFGSNRMLGPTVGKALAGCRWVGVPFAGGMSELVHIKCSSLVVNDLHRRVINLAQVLAHPIQGPKLIRELRRLAFHPDVLEIAQSECCCQATADWPCTEAAKWYFVSQWMGRSGDGGTDREFKGNLSIRWNANGGDSNVRYRSAVNGLREWRQILSRSNFSCLDFREFLAKCKDEPENGVYVDAPWPGDGDDYTHKFTERDHRELAGTLLRFTQARIVVRFGEHPLIRELYSAADWDWRMQTSRTQGNNAKPEALIVRNG